MAKSELMDRLQLKKQKLIKGENVDVESSDLSKREWNELMEAFGLEDKMIK